MKRELDAGKSSGTATSSNAGVPESESAVSPSREIERYRLLEEHGRGGIGRVYRAVDERLQREVAVKQLLRESGKERDRFRREALITARLAHPGIVPVHDMGDGAGSQQPYYVMKLIRGGRTLKECVAEAAGLRERLALLSNLLAVADAIAYAHSVGIIHRDLKPSNVMVGRFGETLVLDWGLAKDLAENVSDDGLPSQSPYRTAAPGITVAGAVVGTPQYMSPEQARGELVDRRSDVYALGALLYYVLSGVAPYTAGSTEEVVARVRAVPPEPLALRVRSVPSDLVAVAQKAMSRNASERYADAGELAEDLRRYLNGQLVAAREPTLRALFVKWVQRHRTPVAASSGFMLLLLVLGGAALQRLRHERAVAIAGRNSLLLQQAESALERDPTRSLAWLKEYPLDAEGWPRAQMIAAHADSRGVARHELQGMAQDLAFSRDRRYLVGGGPDPEAYLWDLETGGLVRSARFDGPLASLRLSPDGHVVATADRLGNVILFDHSLGARRLLGRHQGPAYKVTFSSDSKMVASSGVDSVIIWNLAEGKKELLTGAWGPVIFVAFSPDNMLLAWSASDGTLYQRNLVRHETQKLSGHRGAVTALVFSPTGGYLASAGDDHAVRLWNTATGSGRVLGSHADAILDMAFSGTGQLLATAGADKEVRIWSLNGASRTLTGHVDAVQGVAFSPDGSLLASCGRDRQVRIWDVATGDGRVLLGHRGDLGTVVFSSDGTLLASGGYDIHVRVWDLRKPSSRILGRHTAAAYVVAVSPTGHLVASGSEDRTIKVWNIGRPDGNEHVLLGHQLPVATVAFSPDERLLLSAGHDGTARVWNLEAWRAQKTLTASQHVIKSASFSPDGQLILTVGGEGNLGIWNSQTYALRLLRGPAGAEARGRFYTPSKLLSAESDGSVRVWDLSTYENRLLARLPARGSVFDVHDESHEFALAVADNALRVWHSTDDVAPQVLRGHADIVRAVGFTHSPGRLVTVADDRDIRVWDIHSGHSQILHSSDELVRSMAVGKRSPVVATAYEDGTVHIWNINTSSLSILRAHKGVAYSVRTMPDEQSIVSSGQDGIVRLSSVAGLDATPARPHELASWLRRKTSVHIDHGSTLYKPQ